MESLKLVFAIDRIEANIHRLKCVDKHKEFHSFLVENVKKIKREQIDDYGILDLKLFTC